MSNNKMIADKTIKYDPEKSILKHKIGDTIRLNEAGFTSLFHAFLLKLRRNTPNLAYSSCSRLRCMNTVSSQRPNLKPTSFSNPAS
jgi:hypothetical protein